VSTTLARKIMKFTIPALLLSLILSSVSSAITEKHTFTAPVSSVRLSSELIENGKSRDDTASAQVKAVIFEEPLIIPDFRKAGEHKNPEVNSIINYHKAMLSETAPEVLNLWHPDSRKEKEKQITNVALEQMKDYLREDPQICILGVIYQDHTSSVLLKMGSFVAGFNLRKQDEDLLLTDHPSNDLELAIIEASFSKN
jgi:hypothetical protein